VKRVKHKREGKNRPKIE
jgi:hypothetical protein